MGKQMQAILPINALPPVADRYNTDPATDVMSMRDHAHCDFFLHEGAGATGTANLTIEACDDFVPNAVTAIGFRYRVAQAVAPFGPWITVAAAGYLTIAGASEKIVQCQVDADQLPDGKPNVRMVLTEGVNSPVTAGVMAILSGPRYGEEENVSALS